MVAVEINIVSKTSNDSNHVQLILNGNDCGYLYLTKSEYEFVVDTFKSSENNLQCILKYDEQV